MQTLRGRHAGWMAVALLGLLTACGGGSPAPAPQPEEVPSPPPPAPTALSEPSCPLQYTLTAAAAPVVGLDPKRIDQWHLGNDGRFGTAGEDIRISGAWRNTMGAGVRVAVVDDGVELLHEDLRPNAIQGLSHNYRSTSSATREWPLPCRTSDDHGTAVAGLITARYNNGLGGSGVAPQASLLAYNALATSQDADVMDALNRGLADNAIYNNSWGSRDDGRLHPAEQSFADAIDHGIRTGRGGKGAIYLFPAGNGGCYNPELYPGEVEAGLRDPTPCVRENSNYDGYVNKLGTITVCAVSSTGWQPFYGENGANILVCAPSSDLDPQADIRTTALENQYRSDFTGTSASTPIASGVVALMLAANPSLTWRDVRLLLARSARQNDPVQRTVPLEGGGSFDFDPGWTSNFGLTHSHRYGFGVVDATAAVAAARSWTSVGGSESLKQCGPYSNTTPQPLPDAVDQGPNQPVLVDPVTSTIPIDPSCSIEHIEFAEVHFTATDTAGTGAHPRSGNLRIRLTSPNGLVSDLADAHECYDDNLQVQNCGDYADFPFGSVRHLDEPALGPGGDTAWRLEVTDLIPGHAGQLKQWSLTLYGR